MNRVSIPAAMRPSAGFQTFQITPLLYLLTNARGGARAMVVEIDMGVRHEVAPTVVCYGHIVNKPAVPSAESIGTGVTGNGRVGSCRDNVPPLGE